MATKNQIQKMHIFGLIQKMLKPLCVRCLWCMVMPIQSIKPNMPKMPQIFERRMDKAVQSVQVNGMTPYWAYHDAFQYIEQAAGLKFAGALTPDHHLNPKASQFKRLNQTRPQPFMCLASQGVVSDGIKINLVMSM